MNAPAVLPRPAAPAVRIKRVAESLEGAIRGKPDVIRLALITVCARGHLLIEDVPGVGKSTLAAALARAIGGTFRRIQFTSDLLPSDILGVSVFDAQRQKFEFRPGPIFANVVLADEINRTSPRTQSALLEVMNDGRVSLENQTYQLDAPFFVIATQNPQEHFGTYPLPESQMDRFLLRIRMGYPQPEDERRAIIEHHGEDPIDSVEPALAPQDLLEIQKAVDHVRVDERLLDYVQAVVTATRRSPLLSLGASTRGARAWYQAGRAGALLAGRDYCVPDDFKDLAIPALAHRVVVGAHQESLGRTREEAERILHDILERTPAPT
jgi:MoxR-like ATPase